MANDKFKLVRPFDAGACFSKFKGTSRVLAKSWMCYQPGALQEGRSCFAFLHHDPV